RQSRCLLTSETQTTPTGHDDSTPVFLVFNGSSLLVVTKSDLDPSFADLQLVVDDKPPVRSDKIVRKTDLMFDQNAPELAQLLRAGRQATIYLRFWPTWPATQTFPVRFSLSGFSKAYDSLNQNCQSAPAPAPSRPAR
ncbi:MAG: invasion associated locus B family protein, partial [Candidatus Contendobacter sp.]|nr:invasion associated locus B family protein [Candidatus Contendobacter sp.]